MIKEMKHGGNLVKFTVANFHLECPWNLREGLETVMPSFCITRLEVNLLKKSCNVITK